MSSEPLDASQAHVNYVPAWNPVNGSELSGWPVHVLQVPEGKGPGDEHSFKTRMPDGLSYDFQMTLPAGVNVGSHVAVTCKLVPPKWAADRWLASLQQTSSTVLPLAAPARIIDSIDSDDEDE